MSVGGEQIHKMWLRQFVEIFFFEQVGNVKGYNWSPRNLEGEFGTILL